MHFLEVSFKYTSTVLLKYTSCILYKKNHSPFLEFNGVNGPLYGIEFNCLKTAELQLRLTFTHQVPRNP